jgi:hypothetical protein
MQFRNLSLLTAFAIGLAARSIFRSKPARAGAFKRLVRVRGGRERERARARHLAKDKPKRDRRRRSLCSHRANYILSSGFFILVDLDLVIFFLLILPFDMSPLAMLSPLCAAGPVVEPARRPPRNWRAARFTPGRPFLFSAAGDGSIAPLF